MVIRDDSVVGGAGDEEQVLRESVCQATTASD